MTTHDTSQPGGEILLYQTEDGQTRLETRMTGDTVWLSLNQMAELFHRDKSVISRHIRNVFEEGELRPDATVAKFATVQTEGGKSVSRDIEISHEEALQKAELEFEKYRASRLAQMSRVERDFEEAVKKLPAKPPRKKSSAPKTPGKKK
jgi:hypothetical protein